MNPLTLTLSHRAMDAVLDACRAAQPAEACGYLLGTELDRRVLFVVAVPNVAADPEHYFAIARDDTIETIHRALRLGLAIFGGFHSHPDGPDHLSVQDCADNAHLGPAFVHLLVGRHEAVHAYRILAPARILELSVALDP